jgi:polyisoprenoid-binding protein YceI
MRCLFKRPWLVLGLAMLAGLGARPAVAASLYRIDQRYGTIEFTVTHLGLFTTEGRFARFDGELQLDPEHPERTRVYVRIDANSIEMPLGNEADMLRSPAYFDAARFPTEHFVSTSVEPLSQTHYRLHGMLEIRGVSNPIDLDAVVKDRHFDQVHKVEVADFDVTGRLRRSAFGMRADQVMISDAVKLLIRIHISVEVAPKTG